MSKPARSPSAQDAAPSGVAAAPSRAEVIDTIARVIARRGPAGLGWPGIAREAGDASVARACLWFEDLPELIDACYARTAQGIEESLLRAETAPGTALDQLAAFLVAAFETRRERGQFLSFHPAEELPPARRKRLRERELMILARLKRLLMKGQRDGSLALRHADSACAMILACLQVPVSAATAPEQQMWDGELVELLLAALAEPHAVETVARRAVGAARGACVCGTVSYEVDGPFDVLSHCHCSMCRKHHGSAFASFVSAPLSGFRWLTGEEAVTVYRLAGHGQRCFCRLCGSVVPSVEPESGLVFCPVPQSEES
ncbi:MAG TPA: GFA family protein [Steroidobacteraceae bacterium]|nr:GFA family protein [Steroidobacteraceae bacterium]